MVEHLILESSQNPIGYCDAIRFKLNELIDAVNELSRDLDTLRGE